MKGRIWGCSVAAGVLVLAGSMLRAQAAGGAVLRIRAPARAALGANACPRASASGNAGMDDACAAPERAAGRDQALPGDGEGAFKTGQYRDLFAEAGTLRRRQKAKIEKAFQQLFHGDGQEERVYFENGANENGTLAYITDWDNNDARTEGMSYGMMIAVEFNKKREFDAIWNWAHTYMLITDPKNPSVGYFAWSMNTDGTPRSTGPAPDGESYYVMSLYFAAHRWGNGKGIYNYQAEADKILRGMRHHPVLTGEGPFRIHPDDPPFVQPDHPWPSPDQPAHGGGSQGERQADAMFPLHAAGRKKRPLGRWWTKTIT